MVIPDKDGAPGLNESTRRAVSSMAGPGLADLFVVSGPRPVCVIQDSVSFEFTAIREFVVHFDAYSEFHPDPFPRTVSDVCDHGAIIKHGFGNPSARAGARTAVSKRLAVAKTPKRSIEISRAAFKRREMRENAW